MVLFLLTALAVYLLMHLVIYWGVRPLVHKHPLVPSLTLVFFGLMLLAPFAVRLLEHNGFTGLAQWAARVGYSWMGFALLAFSSFLLLGALHLLVAGAALAFPRIKRLDPHGAFAAAAITLFVAAVGFHGMTEARRINVETVRLTSPKLAPGTPPLRVAQISDLHLGLLLREETLAPVAAKLTELAPDLVLATGDVVDAQLEALDGLSNLFAAVRPPLGKFAILGNHELYVGVDQSVAFLEKSGFRVLRDEVVEPGGRLALVGVDDPGRSKAPVPTDALRRAAAGGLFTLLARHRPETDGGAEGLFDLQLSGHTHGGQIFPFHFIVRQAFPRFSGLYGLPGGGSLYVSRGTGQWGPPMRVLAPPEITLVEISPR